MTCIGNLFVAMEAPKRALAQFALGGIRGARQLKYAAVVFKDYKVQKRYFLRADSVLISLCCTEVLASMSHF